MAMLNTKFEYMWSFMRKNKFNGSNNMSDDLICTICKGLLINPHIGLCGCRYCLDCITEYLNGEAKMCPGDMDECKEELISINENVSPDNATNHRIAKRIVKCPRQNCEFEDELKKIEDHERECQTQSVCYSNVSVECNETQVLQANWPVTGIDGLQKIMELFKTDMTAVIFEMKGMALEITERQKIVERQLREIEHLNESVRSLRAELEDEQSRGRDRNEVIEWIKDQMINVKNDHIIAKEENKLLKEKIENYRESYLALATPELERAGEKCAGNGETSGAKWGEDSAPVNWSKQLSAICMDVAKQNCGEFVWVIDDWSARRKAALGGTATKIYSDTFYSHKNGYRMCLSLYPCGWGSGQDTHLSVVFHLMRGPYDNILQWPFKHPVRVALVNQRTRADHVSFTMLFARFPDHVNWQKPSTEKSAGFAKSRLIELDTISTCPGLCEDNRVFIRCTVTTGEPH